MEFLDGCSQDVRLRHGAVDDRSPGQGNHGKTAENAAFGGFLYLGQFDDTRPDVKPGKLFPP